MNLLNEQEIFESWSPVITQQTSISEHNKVKWLSKYCHFHSLNESAATGYNTLSMLNGMGAPLAPTRSADGSGDKFPSLLPLAIQVAAKTVGFDIVPVIPMQGPTGVLTYLDYVYAGGRLDTTDRPVLIKFNASGTWVVGTTYTATSVASGTMTATYVGKSRIDGYPIFKVGTFSDSTATVAAVIGVAGSTITSAAGSVAATATAALVSALEDHIAGPSGAGSANTSNWSGPYATSTGVGPMNRETGEQAVYNQLGLKTFTKFVEAQTYQLAASVTFEQIQDLQKQYGIDVVSMIENALVNDVSQSINKDILSSAFTLGGTNATAFAATEGGLSLDLNLATLPTAGTYENLQTMQRRIFGRLIAAAAVVANRGRRGPANFVVTNAQIAAAIQDISQFQPAPFNNTATQNSGALYPVGTVAGMTVYVDQNMTWTDTRVLVGRKGADDEPGLKFMPYMMAESISTISEGTMSPKVAVKSRYALVEAGFHPETMYFTFTVTTPTYGIV